MKLTKELSDAVVRQINNPKPNKLAQSALLRGRDILAGIESTETIQTKFPIGITLPVTQAVDWFGLPVWAIRQAKPLNADCKERLALFPLAMGIKTKLVLQQDLYK